MEQTNSNNGTGDAGAGLVPALKKMFDMFLKEVGTLF